MFRNIKFVILKAFHPIGWDVAERTVDILARFDYGYFKWSTDRLLPYSNRSVYRALVWPWCGFLFINVISHTYALNLDPLFHFTSIALMNLATDHRDIPADISEQQCVFSETVVSLSFTVGVLIIQHNSFTIQFNPSNLFRSERTPSSKLSLYK